MRLVWWDRPVPARELRPRSSAHASAFRRFRPRHASRPPKRLARYRKRSWKQMASGGWCPTTWCSAWSTCASRRLTVCRFLARWLSRTIPQATGLDSVLVKHDTELDVVLAIDVAKELSSSVPSSVARINALDRFNHLKYNPPGRCGVGASRRRSRRRREQSHRYVRGDDRELLLSTRSAAC